MKYIKAIPKTLSKAILEMPKPILVASIVIPGGIVLFGSYLLLKKLVRNK